MKDLGLLQKIFNWNPRKFNNLYLTRQTKKQCSFFLPCWFCSFAETFHPCKLLLQDMLKKLKLSPLESKSIELSPFTSFTNISFSSAIKNWRRLASFKGLSAFNHAINLSIYAYKMWCVSYQRFPDVQTNLRLGVYILQGLDSFTSCYCIQAKLTPLSLLRWNSLTIKHWPSSFPSIRTYANILFVYLYGSLWKYVKKLTGS